jgi:hydroxymethylbilane synthase
MTAVHDRHIVIGTRGSDLALWQAHFTKNILERSGFTAELKIIKTQGDRVQDLSFDKLEGKGFFTKEIEDALLADEIDLAVHSCKDMPTEETPGLHISAYSTRANAGDWLLIRPEAYDGSQLLSLKHNAIVGTSSARRKAQLLSFRNDVQVKELRGNVPTRVQKLQEGHYDAIILAAAGLERLNLDLNGLVRVSLLPPLFIPAPAQGVLAWQIREGDQLGMAACHALTDEHSTIVTHIERGLLAAFKGGCQVPLGVYAHATGEHNQYDVWISWADSWNSPVKRIRTNIERPYDPAKLVKDFHHMKPCSVFVTREHNGDTFFSILEQNGFDIHAESFLSFAPVPYKLPGHFDWLFFASRNGVDHFFSQCAMPQGVKIGAVNQGTARHIRGYGWEVDFEGKGQDLQAISSDFSKIVSGGVVLFPQARQSRRTVQQGFPSSQVIDLVVYDDQLRTDIARREEKILVFTSPLNVKAYFSHHQLMNGQQLVAIGPSTADTLHQLGLHCRMAYEPTPWCMADEVMAAAMGW